MLPPAIRDVDYDSEHQRLIVRFQVGSYQYDGVPMDKALALKRAFHQRDVHPGEDVTVFNLTIEGKYKSTRIGS